MNKNIDLDLRQQQLALQLTTMWRRRADRYKANFLKPDFRKRLQKNPESSLNHLLNQFDALVLFPDDDMRNKITDFDPKGIWAGGLSILTKSCLRWTR